MPPRADKKKNLDKAAASLAKNPLQTEAELAKDVWIGAWTAHRAKKQLEESGEFKDERIISLSDKDLECVELWVKEINRRLSTASELEKMRTPEISQVIKENTARYTLFRWEATDPQWALKVLDLSDINEGFN